MADATQLQAGIAPVTITPDRPLLLEGYGSQAEGRPRARSTRWRRRRSSWTTGPRARPLSPRTCAASSRNRAERIRVAARASGVPGENIMITYSHSHSAPLVTPFAAEVG